MNDWNNLRVGDRVYVRDEKRPYRVRCRDKRFIICTKPYNPKHTVLYFVADLVRLYSSTLQNRMSTSTCGLASAVGIGKRR